ncbi:MAG TPA: pilus assembly protein TadG-related protein [Allosphingosinicella sp.]|jgi:Flp pilus assembly protein TadG
MRLIKTLSDLRQCKRGNALIVVAATAPLLIAASAIGLDTIQVTLAKRQLQRSADSAAMAGAYALMQNQTTSAAEAAVDRDLTLNNLMVLSAPRVVQHAPQTGPFTGDPRAVRVVLSAQRSVPFISFFTKSSMDIRVEATAAAVPTGNYCVVSLENTAATGITFSGNATVNLGCGVATNSTGSSAISFNGGPSVTASPVAARGGVPAASNFLGNTTVIPNAPAQPDPFAHLPNPDISTMNCVNANTSGPTLSPGCYNGLDFKDKDLITLSPGTYYVNGGELSFGSQANVTANGVTFVLTSKNAVSNPASIASLKMNGGADVRLTAPTTGPYPGLIIYQDRRAPNDSPHINGGSNASFDGAIYLPSQDVTFNGNSGLDVVCLRLVTLRVKFSGTTDLINNCPANHPSRGFSGLAVRLVN